MTEVNESAPDPESRLEPADVQAPDTGADVEAPDTIEAARKLRSENRSLRTRLRTAEADNERLLTQQGVWQHREIERTAAEVLVDPADVWRIDPELQQGFYDKQFAISTDNVVAAAKALAAEKPHLAKPNTAPPPSSQPIEGLRPGASPAEKPKPTSWAAAIRGT